MKYIKFLLIALCSHLNMYAMEHAYKQELAQDVRHIIHQIFMWEMNLYKADFVGMAHGDKKIARKIECICRAGTFKKAMRGLYALCSKLHVDIPESESESSSSDSTSTSSSESDMSAMGDTYKQELIQNVRNHIQEEFIWEDCGMYKLAHDADYFIDMAQGNEKVAQEIKNIYRAPTFNRAMRQLRALSAKLQVELPESVYEPDFSDSAGSVSDSD